MVTIIIENIIMFLLAFGENSTHTLQTRAINSSSIWYNGIATAISISFYLGSKTYLVFMLATQGVRYDLLGTYLVAAVISSTGTQWIAMKFIEKPKI